MSVIAFDPVPAELDLEPDRDEDLLHCCAKDHACAEADDCISLCGLDLTGEEFIGDRSRAGGVCVVCAAMVGGTP